jgi:hypothetical protein
VSEPEILVSTILFQNLRITSTYYADFVTNVAHIVDRMLVQPPNLPTGLCFPHFWRPFGTQESVTLGNNSSSLIGLVCKLQTEDCAYHWLLRRRRRRRRIHQSEVRQVTSRQNLAFLFWKDSDSFQECFKRFKLFLLCCLLGTNGYLS